MTSKDMWYTYSSAISNTSWKMVKSSSTEHISENIEFVQMKNRALLKLTLTIIQSYSEYVSKENKTKILLFPCSRCWRRPTSWRSRACARCRRARRAPRWAWARRRTTTLARPGSTTPSSSGTIRATRGPARPSRAAAAQQQQPVPRATRSRGCCSRRTSSRITTITIAIISPILPSTGTRTTSTTTCATAIRRWEFANWRANIVSKSLTKQSFRLDHMVNLTIQSDWE